MATPTVVTQELSPTLMGIPREIRRDIINYVILLEKGDNVMQVDEDHTVQKYDFSISAAGLRSHSMESFQLLFVNKQLYIEALSLVYMKSSVVLYTEVTHNARAFGFIPTMLNNIPSGMKLNTRVVGVKFYNIATPYIASLSPGENVSQKKAGERNLTAAVDTIMNEFLNRKALHISAGVNGARFDDLKALFQLLSVEDKFITMEEIWQLDGTVYTYMKGFQHSYNMYSILRKKHEALGIKAATAIGQEWFQNSKAPILIEDRYALVPFYKPHYGHAIARTARVWRGSGVGFARRRVWKRDTTGPTPEMAEYLKERLYPATESSS